MQKISYYLKNYLYDNDCVSFLQNSPNCLYAVRSFNSWICDSETLWLQHFTFLWESWNATAVDDNCDYMHGLLFALIKGKRKDRNISLNANKFYRRRFGASSERPCDPLHARCFHEEWSFFRPPLFYTRKSNHCRSAGNHAPQLMCFKTYLSILSIRMGDKHDFHYSKFSQKILWIRDSLKLSIKYVETSFCGKNEEWWDVGCVPYFDEK